MKTPGHLIGVAAIVSIFVASSIPAAEPLPFTDALHIPRVEDDVAVSPDGGKLLYRVKNGNLPGQSRMLGMRSGQELPVPPSASRMFLPRWSPDGTWVAFYEIRDARIAVKRWNVVTGEVAAVDEFPGTEREVTAPQWRKKGDSFFYIRPLRGEAQPLSNKIPTIAPGWSGPAEAGVAVRIDTSGLSIPLRSDFLGADELSRSPLSYGNASPELQRLWSRPLLGNQLMLATMDREKPLVIRDLGHLGLDPICLLSPQADWLAVNTRFTPADPRSGLLILSGDNPEASSREISFTDPMRLDAFSPQWSVNGNELFVVTRSPESRILHRVDIASGRIVGSVLLPAANTGKKTPQAIQVQRPDFGRAPALPIDILPSPSGDSIFWRDCGDLFSWKFGEDQPQNLTASLPWIVDGLFPIQANRYSGFWVTLLDPSRSRSGLARVSPDQREPGTPIWQDEILYPLRNRSGGPSLLLRMSDESPWNLTTLEINGDESKLKPLTREESDLASYDLGKSTALTWIYPANQPSGGNLLLPTRIPKPEKGYPLVVIGYPDNDPRPGLHTFSLDSLSDSALPRLLVSRGYAVLLPHLPLRAAGLPGARQMTELNDAMNAALDAAAASGTIDTSRIGIYGYSWGGYMVNCLITGNNRFRAAIAGAGYADAIAAYTGGSNQAMMLYEGQNNSGLGGTLWQYPERFIENSPIFHMDKVTTPLLLIHGGGDQVVVPEASRQVFRALRRLGKPVVLVVYEKGGHTTDGWDEPQQIDFHRRIVAWFDTWLLGN